MKKAPATYLFGDSDLLAQDRPIEQEADDELDREVFVESLRRALIRDVTDTEGVLVARKSTGFVVGLTGSWGSGKSSVLNLLALRLGSLSRVVVAKFNPWLFRGRDELLTAFFNELRQAMGRSNVEHARELITALDRYRGAIEATATVAAAGADVMGAGGTATVGVRSVKRLWSRPKEKPLAVSIQEERKALETKLKNIDSAVVVLIDELDRVEDEDVKAVAQLIKAVGDIKGISYLVAYDPDRVADALGRGNAEERKASGHSYLEKIIQHPIPMRPLFTEDVDRLLRSALGRHQIELAEPEAEYDQGIYKILREEVSTPREIKRLIGSFAVIEAAVRGEVNPLHVLAYSWLLTKGPSVRTQIAARLDRFVDDPPEEEMVRRAFLKSDEKKREELSDDAILGAYVGAFEALLKRLFPRFSEDTSNQDGTRLSLRRNLVRVLYLGNPPGAPSRTDIEQIWGLTSAGETEALLRGMLADGSLPGFLDRLDDLLPSLPESGDQAFWVGLSRTFTRSTDWLQGPEPERALSDDAAMSLFRLGLRDRSEVPRVKRAVESLRESGDLIFVPWILRKSMFQHGLVQGEPPRHGNAIFDDKETSLLLETELPRYKAALCDGTLLRRVPTVEAWFVLKNGGFWDQDLFESLSAQAKSFEAVQTIAGLLTPPGYVMKRETVAEMLDAEALFARIEEMPTPANPWLQQAVRRMKLTLQGKDTIFADDDEDMGD